MFSDTILDHFKHPRNFRELEDATIAREAYNPVCGDRIRLMLRIADGRIDAATFKGDCCAISMAATSLLTELLAGRDLEQARALEDQVLLRALDSEIKSTRMDCALLPLRALRDALASTQATRD